MLRISELLGLQTPTPKKQPQHILDSISKKSDTPILPYTEYVNYGSINMQ